MIYDVVESLLIRSLVGLQTVSGKLIAYLN